jgi:hypothetical protein
MTNEPKPKSETEELEEAAFEELDWTENDMS